MFPNLSEYILWVTGSVWISAMVLQCVHMCLPTNSSIGCNNIYKSVSDWLLYLLYYLVYGAFWEVLSEDGENMSVTNLASYQTFSGNINIRNPIFDHCGSLCLQSDTWIQKMCPNVYLVVLIFRAFYHQHWQFFRFSGPYHIFTKPFLGIVLLVLCLRNVVKAHSTLAKPVSFIQIV